MLQNLSNISYDNHDINNNIVLPILQEHIMYIYRGYNNIIYYVLLSDTEILFNIDYCDTINSLPTYNIFIYSTQMPLQYDTVDIVHKVLAT